MALPTFFIAGAPKAGTTALHVALARHPQLFMTRVKEPKFFLTDGPPPRQGGPGDARTYRQYVWRRADYEALFDAAPPGAMRGESTSLYLYDPAAQRRIAAAVPDARFVLLLRDPVDRAHSNWAHLWSAGLEPEKDFLRACELEDQRARDGWAAFWRYRDLGRYGRQLEQLYSRFPRDQVLVLRYRELRETPVPTLDRICAFLGVATGVLTEVPAENVTTQASDSWGNRALSVLLRAGTVVEHRLPERYWGRVDTFLARHLQREQKLRQPLTPAQRARLLPTFADDVRALERITGESFGDWLDAHRPVHRASLAPQGRIGTAHGSIDYPLGD
jgi:hypothetical protein